MKPRESPATSADQMLDSYVELTRALLGGVTGLCLLDPHLDCLGQRGRVAGEALSGWLRELGWVDKEPLSRRACTRRERSGRWVTALPLETSENELLGVLCVEQTAEGEAPAARHGPLLAQKLRPVLDCLHRELAARQPERKKLQTLTERTAELEWLFKITSDLRGSSDERRVLEQLLSAATERLRSAFGVLLVPDKGLCLEHVRDEDNAEVLRAAWSQARPSLLTWVQRQRRPLVVNGAGRTSRQIARCKILCVPIVRESGRVIGALAFFNPPKARDYQNRHTFLARHLGRQTAGVVEAQFDLMTGLYTREGLEQMYARLADAPEQAERSVIYIDVDHMHIVNELHGFELGNELIVRVADLVAPPQLPEGSLTARISGDRFAAILPRADARSAVAVAERLQQAIKRLIIGPARNPIEVSVSCGVAALVSMPQGLARALAAAELACKTAKKRGRSRVELYACADASMMRRHDDVIAVGELRSALKSDRLVLFAQRIAPLQDTRLPGGYEILLRLRGADGALVAPGPLISAAERYQLLPSVDRWVGQRALQLLSPYRRMLQSRGLTISLNLSGQSFATDDYTQQLVADLKTASLPCGCLALEITEQAAVASLGRANEMIRQLSPWGCKFALDDFGTGSNSLTYLKALPIARVKIDGSFVRDIVTNARSQATVRGIVELARGFSIDTVAEFVETEAIAEKVRALGVDYAQGYAFGRPEPLESVLESLAHDESERLHHLFLEM
ncbi:MAG TPA: GGDEF domain-containing protein [Steroidobacteraceae bacterium]|nr:GGDEF domain-containing protein [Steroidobacteraceae bacterium]